MATETITIRKQAKGTGLYLTDNEGNHGKNTITTIVRAGDTVVWQLKPKGGITAITDIYPKKGSKNIFSTNPAKQPNGNWQGIVANNASGTESYSIDYTIGKNSYTDDPKLNVQT